ncbi:hypothetical protein HPP92_015069 [Vanilla planifolia]|uniref:Uncharacterized protein n=1 Tax=Vanilla planifolia TaxID=51239 RepID=A0A835QVR9_VANPL|nr:hypothetical protein HPP92_015069 [Vanilla planifolia]
MGGKEPRGDYHEIKNGSFQPFSINGNSEERAIGERIRDRLEGFRAMGEGKIIGGCNKLWFSSFLQKEGN